MAKSWQFQPNNPGRKLGSKNKSTVVKAKTRERIASIFENQSLWDKYLTELSSLKGRYFTQEFRGLIEYILPKWQATHLSLSNMPEADLAHFLEKIKEELHEYQEDRSN